MTGPRPISAPGSVRLDSTDITIVSFGQQPIGGGQSCADEPDLLGPREQAVDCAGRFELGCGTED